MNRVLLFVKNNEKVAHFVLLNSTILDEFFETLDQQDAKSF